jgi:hypothetical protein
MRGKRLNEIDVPALFRLWASGMPEREICQRLGVRPGSFYVLKDRMKLPARPKAEGGDDFAAAEPPTPEEIAERAAAIRAKWPPEEEERRRVGPRHPVEMRRFCYDGRSVAFAEST